MFNSCKKLLNKLLSEESCNSRFVYLLSGVVIKICVLVVVVAFVFDSHRDYYSEMLLILLSGGVGNGFSRFLTKKGDSTVEVSKDKEDGK